MKTNYWLVLATFLATAAVAQEDTNTLPAIPVPATADASAAMAAPAVPAATPAPAKPKPAAKKKAPKKLDEPSVSLVPGNATVIARNLNVRGQAGAKGEVIGRLQNGEVVNVLSQINLDKHAIDEPAQWAKVALPSGSKVWVSAHFVDPATKTVTARRLNLRAGPGENYSPLGLLEKGETITEISKQGDWIEIEAPATAGAFVAAMYLMQEAPTPIAAVVAQPAPVQTHVTAAPEPAPEPVAPTTVTEPPAVTAGAATAVSTSSEAAEPAMRPPVTYTTGGVEIVVPSAPIDTNIPPPPPRVVSHQGIVRPSVSPVAPTYYELYNPDTGLAINYLYPPTTALDMSDYNGSEIIVTGEEGLHDRWPATPVLTIQKIYVVNLSPVEPTKRLATPRASDANIRGNKPQTRR